MRKIVAYSSRGGLQDDEETKSFQWAEFQAVHLVSTLSTREGPKFKTTIIYMQWLPALTSVNGSVMNLFLLSLVEYAFASCQGPKPNNSIALSWCGVSIVSLPFVVSTYWEIGSAHKNRQERVQ